MIYELEIRLKSDDIIFLRTDKEGFESIERQFKENEPFVEWSDSDGQQVIVKTEEVTGLALSEQDPIVKRTIHDDRPEVVEEIIKHENELRRKLGYEHWITYQDEYGVELFYKLIK